MSLEQVLSCIKILGVDVRLYKLLESTENFSAHFYSIHGKIYAGG